MYLPPAGSTRSHPPLSDSWFGEIFTSAQYCECCANSISVQILSVLCLQSYPYIKARLGPSVSAVDELHISCVITGIKMNFAERLAHVPNEFKHRRQGG